MKKEKHIIIYPMLPRNFSRKKRAEIRRKEKEILSSSNDSFGKDDSEKKIDSSL